MVAAPALDANACIDIPVAAVWGPRLKIAIVVALAIVLYARVLAGLVLAWWNDPGASHGLLIPPIACYIAWARRDLTFSRSAIADNCGILAVLAACLLFLVGKLGAEFFVTRLSLLVFLGGLTWTFWGLKRLRTLAFPLVLMLTMIPLPAILYNVMAAPLQLFASSVSADLVQWIGVAVYRDGNIIHLPGITLGVVEACSGLRSLSSLAVLALLVGYLQCSRLRTRAAILAVSIPIAIGVNVLRIAGTAVIAEQNRTMAMGFYHAFSGWLVFLAGLGSVLLAAKVLRTLTDRSPDEHAIL